MQPNLIYNLQVTLANPRSFCAGVVRAIEIVEKALKIYGSPVYVLHEIVHNKHVVDSLRAQGAIFVETLEEVPEGETIIFSAHGVSRERIEQAQQKYLNIIDATCPLVTKVHREVDRYARKAKEVILIGHAGHVEVEGTLGQYDRQWGGDIYLVQNVEDVYRLKVKNPENLGYVTQTTLSFYDTQKIIRALKKRFPLISSPKKNDICYATQNRQQAVIELAEKVDVLLVVGAKNSSNANRLREVGEERGISSYLIEDADELQEEWISPDTHIGITAGASTPEKLVRGVLNKLRVKGVAKVTEMQAAPETIVFPLPAQVRSSDKFLENT